MDRPGLFAHTVIIIHSSPFLYTLFRLRKVRFLSAYKVSYYKTINTFMYMLTWRSFSCLMELNEFLALLVELDNKVHQSLFLNATDYGLRLFWRANRFLTSLCSLPLSKGLLSLNTPWTDDSAWMYWVRLPTASWLGTGNGPSLTPQAQQGFAEPLHHKLSKDLLSLCSTNSARICWAWLHSGYIHKTRDSALKEAESDSTTRYVQGTKT